MNAAIAFDSVSAGYRNQPVLREVSVGFAPGQVTGLVGPNGAGKTTLFRVALRLLRLAQGQICVLGRPLSQWHADDLARAIAYLPQETEAAWPIEARRLVALGRLPHRPALSPLSADDWQAIEAALARCDAGRLSDRPVSYLSAGERARILLARALAVGAPILLADEPAAHLDPSHQLRLMELLRAEAARGTAVVVTLHDLTLASRFCDRLIVLDEGRVVAEGRAAEALSDDVLGAVFAIGARRIESGIVPWQRI